MLAGLIEIVKYTFEISETRGGARSRSRYCSKEDWMHCFGKNFYEVGL